MKMIKRARLGVPLALAVIAAGGLIAACGSASSTSTSSAAASATAASSTSSGAGTARRTALVACLKTHGVTLPARPAGGFRPPTGTGTGSSTTPRPNGGFFRSNPKMQAALKACGANFGGGLGGGRFLGRVSHTAVTSYATCLRQHGVSVPAPNFSGKGPVFPASIRSSAKFPAASRACQSLLVPSRSGATTTTTASTA
jgi:hypothetical protein